MQMHQSIEAMAKDYLLAIRSVQPKGTYNILVYCFSVAVGTKCDPIDKSGGDRQPYRYGHHDRSVEIGHDKSPPNTDQKARQTLISHPGKTVQAMVTKE